MSRNVREMDVLWNANQTRWQGLRLAVDIPKDPLVIYHAHCADGVAAAWAFKFFLGTEVEFFAGAYGKEPPHCAGRAVYFVDFCYPLEVMCAVLAVASQVTVLDHHVTSLKAMEPLEGNPKMDIAYSTSARSGAMLAWLFLTQQHHSSELAPSFLLHVEDRDLWRFKHHQTNPLMAYFFSNEVSIENVAMMIADMGNPQVRGEILAIGHALIKNKETIVKNILATAKRRIILFGFDVPLINCSGMFASDVGNIASRDELFAVTYQDNEGERQFSLRSQQEGGMDVSEIAKKFGGGGHKNASGFKVSRDHVLAKI